ncbi:MAG: hybrid sensor histidine kinase/response regulator [Bacteroidales bacterium]|nr:hybrid sensor histidine kinase/response regulator [Bacteroidales bacterium]
METFKGSKILVVDDELANIYFLKKVLSAHGYEVTTASGGYEAIVETDKQDFDTILLDIMMPEITGIDVLKRLKQNDLTRSIPVIMVSAKTDPADIETALDMGAVEYIKKPVEETELLARVRTTLRISHFEKELLLNIKAKEEFISIVAHDLRTPFASISGFARFLKEDEQLAKALTDEHKEFLDFITNSSAFLVEYFNKLLNWTQISSKGIKLSINKVNLSRAMENIYLVYKAKLKEKDIMLYSNLPEELSIEADEVFFNQLISNIVGNAIKFTPQGGSINLFTTGDGALVNIHIKDSGRGISQENIEMILSDKPIKSQKGTMGEKGTGLGLKICKKIAAAHGYGLHIRSEINLGTEILIQQVKVI